MTVHISYHVKKINKFLQKRNSAAEAVAAAAVAAATAAEEPGEQQAAAPRVSSLSRLSAPRYLSSVKKK